MFSRFTRFIAFVLALAFSLGAYRMSFALDHIPADKSDAYAQLRLRLNRRLEIPRTGLFVQHGILLADGKKISSWNPYCFLRYAAVADARSPSRLEFQAKSLGLNSRFTQSDSSMAFPSKMSAHLKSENSKVQSGFEKGFEGLHLQCTNVASIREIQTVFQDLASLN
jgi:hypothetical protein